jgi:predicted deacetylase
LIALHDVTPVHWVRLERAERVFESLGVERLAYLLVPNFHGCSPAGESPEFIDWCRASRPFDLQWFLHGYFHHDRPEDGAEGHALSVGERLAATFMTNGEAECMSLADAGLRRRLADGLDVFQACLGRRPIGFIPPAWLFNRHLLPVLADLRLEITEGFFSVIDVPGGRAVPAPVVTWATRNFVRRYGSLATAAAQRRMFNDREIVRVALHPQDFDHQRTIDSIARSLDWFRRDRSVARYDASIFARDEAVTHA